MSKHSRSTSNNGDGSLANSSAIVQSSHNSTNHFAGHQQPPLTKQRLLSIIEEALQILEEFDDEQLHHQTPFAARPINRQQ
jgi:hypothetical protein